MLTDHVTNQLNAYLEMTDSELDRANEHLRDRIDELEAEHAQARNELEKTKAENQKLQSRIDAIEAIDLLPGEVTVPFFKTDEEYQNFLAWWKENVTESLLKATAERDRLQSTVAALERERSNFAHIALRVIDNDYLAWQAAGGPRECEHGRAEGIPCPECDIVTVRSFLAEEERLAALAEPKEVSK